MTGSLVQRNDWIGRKVAGNINNQFHFNIGGCTYDNALCPFSQVRACYGCLYFKPFIDGEHQKVFDSINEELIQLIRSERIKHGISQENLALLTDIDRSYVGRIERGEVNITVEKLYQIANVLKCSPSELLP
ncbi:helix-turn-helix transcriptional regulator [Proteus mirabilis]|nr:helix-turn-helix transcriptional regulator [Proteus mirabilis]MBG5957196.1 helix-turn-helix transcriptional regulator [Proteus mirabilis]